MKNKLPLRNSIRAQLAAVFVLLLLGVVAALVFSHSRFLQRYLYLSRITKKQIKRSRS